MSCGNSAAGAAARPIAHGHVQVIRQDVDGAHHGAQVIDRELAKVRDEGLLFPLSILIVWLVRRRKAHTRKNTHLSTKNMHQGCGLELWMTLEPLIPLQRKKHPLNSESSLLLDECGHVQQALKDIFLLQLTQPAPGNDTIPHKNSLTEPNVDLNSGLRTIQCQMCSYAWTCSHMQKLEKGIQPGHREIVWGRGNMETPMRSFCHCHSPLAPFQGS